MVDRSDTREALERVCEAASKYAERLRWLGYESTIADAAQIDAAVHVLAAAPTDTGERGLLDDVPRFNEVARLEHDGRVLVCYGAKGWYMIANEDDVTRQSVVLTTHELRWLADLWRPSALAAALSDTPEEQPEDLGVGRLTAPSVGKPDASTEEAR